VIMSGIGIADAKADVAESTRLTRCGHFSLAFDLRYRAAY
jgi:hypothetical protein